MSDASECAFRHVTHVRSREKAKHQEMPGPVGHFQTDQLGHTLNSATLQMIQNIIDKGEKGGKQ